MVCRSILLIKTRNVFLAIFLILTNCLFSEPTSYALPDCNGVPLDKKFFNIINCRNGFFIEVGANDGVTQSNTKMLEESYGWKGILIEPSASLFPILVANRPHSKCFQCALGSFEQDGKYLSGTFDGTLMAAFEPDKKNKHGPACIVLTRSLQSILDECGVKHVTFFSLDTEGYEFNILKGIDFEKITFDYLLIEINAAQFKDIVSFLSAKGYDVVENFTNYTLATNPGWSGTHNDYLFKRRSLDV